MELKKIRRFVINGVTMTVAALLIRGVGVIFNAYVAKTVGAEALGLYSLLSGVYGFSLTLALSGIHLAVTRLVSEYLAEYKIDVIPRVMKKAFLLSLFFSAFASFILFFLTDTVASDWLHDLRVILPLKFLCITLPAAAVSSVINGYFTAVRRVYKNALSQIIEMTIKIVVTVILFSLLFQNDAANACVLLSLSSVIAEIGVLFFNLTVYIFDKKLHLTSCTRKSTPGTIKKILGISMPVALTSYFRSGLVSLEHSLIPKGLMKYGSDRASALSAYGTLGSMALTVINFPYALLGSFSSLLIPEITESRTQNKKRHISYISFRTYQASAVFSCCLAGFFFEFSHEIGNFIYSSSLAGEYIKKLAFLVPIMYTDTATDSLLKGMGEQLYTMKVNIADAIISVFLVWILVPRYGIDGYIATIYVAEIINATFSIFKAVKVCRIEKRALSVYALSALASLGAIMISRIIIRPIGGAAYLHLTIYFLLYILIVKATEIYTKDDMRWLRSIMK